MLLENIFVWYSLTEFRLRNISNTRYIIYRCALSARPNSVNNWKLWKFCLNALDGPQRDSYKRDLQQTFDIYFFASKSSKKLTIHRKTRLISSFLYFFTFKVQNYYSCWWKCCNNKPGLWKYEFKKSLRGREGI